MKKTFGVLHKTSFSECYTARLYFGLDVRITFFSICLHFEVKNAVFFVIITSFPYKKCELWRKSAKKVWRFCERQLIMYKSSGTKPAKYCNTQKLVSKLAKTSSFLSLRHFMWHTKQPHIHLHTHTLDRQTDVQRWKMMSDQCPIKVRKFFPKSGILQ